MQIFTELNENKNLSIALGYFDGVHLGHQKVILSAVNFARQNGNKSAVITFKDHPCCHFYGVCPKYILSRQARREYIATLGIDYLYELDFNDRLCSLPAGEYLEEVLVKYFSPKSISTGFNHFFGAQKSGDADFLREKQTQYGYKYFEIPPQKFNDEIISSTAIRNYLQKGEIEQANSILGHNFSVNGKVVEGQKLGRTLGFRTANLIYPTELIDLPFGVYETLITPRPLREEFVNEQSEFTNSGEGYKAITNFGIRPTISKEKNAVLETHILNFDNNIYGETIEIKFIRMLRKEIKFNSVEELKTQIKSDISKIFHRI